MNTLTLTLPAATIHVLYDLRRAFEEVFASWERYQERGQTLRAVLEFGIRAKRVFLPLPFPLRGTFPFCGL